MSLAPFDGCNGEKKQREGPTVPLFVCNYGSLWNRDVIEAQDLF